MPKKIKACRNCGKTGVPLSRKNKLCFKCGVEKQLEVINQIRKREGIYYERWKFGIANWVKGMIDEHKA